MKEIPAVLSPFRSDDPGMSKIGEDLLDKLERQMVNLRKV